MGTTGKHVIDQHRNDLINRLVLVDPVLDDLLTEGILTDEQYDKVRCQQTSQQKMRTLYDFSRAWGERDKDTFFIALKRHNKPLIDDLCEPPHKTQAARKPPTDKRQAPQWIIWAGLSCAVVVVAIVFVAVGSLRSGQSPSVTPQDGNHFVDKHRASLISKVSLVNPVLDDLLAEGLLTEEQYGSVRNEKTSQDKMRMLFEFIRAWGTPDKDKFYEALNAHNGPLIKNLESPKKSKM